jgi:hypothetical protein
VLLDYGCNDHFSNKLHVELVDDQDSACYRNLGVRTSKKLLESELNFGTYSRSSSPATFLHELFSSLS